MRITSPISWPLAKILDYLMGEHEITRFNNVELKHLIKLHTKDALKDVSFTGDGHEDVGLDNHQAEMIAGALTLESLKIGDNEKQILTPVMEMKFLMLDTVLDSQSIFWIKDVGYSRFPIVISSKHRFIVAILLSKSLIGLKPSTKTIQELYLEGKIKLKVPLYISKDAEISKVVQTFAGGSSHLAVVCESPLGAEKLRQLSKQVFESYEEMINQQYWDTDQIITPQSNYDLELLKLMDIVGILTLENVLECILNMKILDEHDRDDVVNKITKQKGTITNKESLVFAQ